ncbi:MAG: adenylate kinase family protein [Candidatus Bilamarchaeaceae archaeon]
MRVIITGTPGTGKTSVAAEVARKAGLRLVSIPEIVKRKRLGKRSGKETEVDTVKLRKALLTELRGKKGWMMESHLLCETRIPADHVFVLRCGRAELERRIRKRGYPEKKVMENLLAELLDYCSQRCAKNYPKARLWEIDTTRRTPKGTVGRIMDVMRGKRRGDRVDHGDELMRFAMNLAYKTRTPA